MRKRTVYLILAGLVLAVVVVGLATREREPEYQGKMLREWVAVYDSSNGRQGADAIRAIGKSALPFLVRWTGYETPRWEHQLNLVLHKISAGHLGLSLEPDMAPSTAARAFRALGPEAETAIPELTRMLNGRSDGHSAFRAACELVSIGPKGLPPVVVALTNTQARKSARCAAGRALWNAEMDGQTNFSSITPALKSLLADPDFFTRDFASNALSVATNGPVHIVDNFTQDGTPKPPYRKAE